MTERWQMYALCAGADEEIFFPPTYGYGMTKQAKRICADCPVRRQCLRYAITLDIEHGIFGGYTPSQRNKIASAAGHVNIRRWKDTKPHGSEAAIRRHKRHKEELCRICTDALPDLYAAKWAKRKQAQDAVMVTV